MGTVLLLPFFLHACFNKNSQDGLDKNKFISPRYTAKSRTELYSANSPVNGTSIMAAK